MDSKKAFTFLDTLMWRTLPVWLILMILMAITHNVVVEVFALIAYVVFVISCTLSTIMLVVRAIL